MIDRTDHGSMTPNQNESKFMPVQQSVFLQKFINCAYCNWILQAAWDWLILILVIYTAIFTPYVAAFQLNEPDFDKRSRSFGEDPIVVIDMIGNMRLYLLINVNLSVHVYFYTLPLSL